MKTMLEGVELTPETAEILRKWYEDSNDTAIARYVRWLAKIQDYLTRAWVERDEDDDGEFKDCVGCLILIKDDLERLIPKGGEA